MIHPLLTSTGFNRAAIMVRAWARARRDVAAGWTVRQALRSALRFVWDEAKSARSLIVWQAGQTAARAAATALDARTREIAALRFDRFAADRIDNTRQHLAEVRRIDARLAELISN